MIDQLATFLSSKPGIVVTALIAFLILERLFPVAAWVWGIWRLLRNMGLSGLNAILSPLLVIPLTQFAAANGLQWRPEAWSGPWFLLLDILLLDAWIYWWHRANHVVPILWRFHEVHHLDETLDATSALRFHFGEVAASAVVRAMVIIVLGIPFASVAVFETLIVVTTLFHHSNLRVPSWLERPLSYVIVTPSIHWVHHHAQRSDTDSNYATFLSLWDRLFSSRSATTRTQQMAIGVEGKRDTTLLGLILKPFRQQ